MNPVDTELIQVPKSHLQSMTTRLLGIKNLIRILVAKENEVKFLKKKYQTMETKHSEEIQKFISRRIEGLSVQDFSPTASYHSLPLQNYKTKEVGVSEETYYSLLKEFCHTRSVLSILQKTSEKPLMIESWTQTDEKSIQGTTTDIDTEPTQICQAQQEEIEKQHLELEFLREKNAGLLKKLEQESSSKRLVVEKEKQASARLKRELELHENTKQKLQELKAKEIRQDRFHKISSTCSSEVSNDHLQYDFEDIEVDGFEESPQPSKICQGCKQVFPNDEKFEYHISICKKLKQNSNK